MSDSVPSHPTIMTRPFTFSNVWEEGVWILQRCAILQKSWLTDNLYAYAYQSYNCGSSIHDNRLPTCAHTVPEIKCSPDDDYCGYHYLSTHPGRQLNHLAFEIYLLAILHKCRTRLFQHSNNSGRFDRSDGSNALPIRYRCLVTVVKMEPSSQLVAISLFTRKTNRIRDGQIPVHLVKRRNRSWIQNKSIAELTRIVLFA